jgi:GMP synthase (glutamine-hydrolysing)
MPTFVCTPGFITRSRADLLREADAIVTEEIRAADLYNKIWQMPVVLLPVGVEKGNDSLLHPVDRDYGGQAIVLRPVSSIDAMTADARLLPEAVLKQITRRLMDLPGIDAVFMDLTSKPPATIEWE